MALMAGEFYESGGTPVARPASMARRITAFLAMVAIVLIVVAVMWRVYRHHQTNAPSEEPAIVDIGSAAARLSG